jgi:predicted dehydrogenase
MELEKKRYAIVGCGSRHDMYARALTGDFSEYGELVALCDRNEGRLRKSHRQHAVGGDRLYGEADFEKMIGENRPDVVIVTTQDSFHDRYIVGAMESGCDVITEKPLTIDEMRCRRVLETAERTGRDLRVTFNYRYSPPRTQVKHLLAAGTVGRIVSADFHWYLDTRHGADYFRRWHRRKENSGGLLVHKATHHFDLVNWWLESRPEEVFARGERRFYTPKTAERYGLEGRAERCLGCRVAGRCPFYLDIEEPGLKEMYRDCEVYDSYFRDRCVFSDEIDIEDTVSLTAVYRSGAFLSYSLNAFCPKEGYEIGFNGTKGRLEHRILETSYVSGRRVSQTHETIAGASSTWIFPHFDTPYQVPLWTAEGSHGGGDALMLADLFLPPAVRADRGRPGQERPGQERPGQEGPGPARDGPKADYYRRAAGLEDGVWSILTGIAANRSIETGTPVRVPGLLEGSGCEPAGRRSGDRRGG